MRHQGINIRVLHETFHPRDPETCEPLESQCHMEYIISALQKADIFTKAFRDAVTWKKTLGLIGINTLPRLPDGLPLALPTPPKENHYRAVGKATGGNAVANPALTSADRDLLTDLLEPHLRDYQVEGTKTSKPTTTRREGSVREVEGEGPI